MMGLISCDPKKLLKQKSELISSLTRALNLFELDSTNTYKRLVVKMKHQKFLPRAKKTENILNQHQPSENLASIP